MRGTSARTAILVLLAIGCSRGSSAEATKPDAGAGPETLGTLHATVDGRPVSMKTALATSHGGRSFDLLVSSVALTCADMKRGWRSIAKGQVDFTVTVAPILGTDGSETWGITFASYGVENKNGGDIGKAQVFGEPAVTGPVRVGLDFAIDSPEMKAANSPASKLVVAGDLTAEGCGVTPVDASPRPEKDLTLTVAGKRFVILGAIVQPTSSPKGHDLTLSTQPFDCRGVGSGRDLELRIHLGEDGKSAGTNLSGNVFTSQYSAAPAHSDTFAAKPRGPLDGDGDVDVDVSGQLDVNGFPVKLDGSLSAKRCPG